MAEAGPDRSSKAQRAVPRLLLTLHEKANGAGLDGEGIQAWLEWEMEAMLWGVSAEISGADLEALVKASEVPLELVDDASGTQVVRSHYHRGAGRREGSR